MSNSQFAAGCAPDFRKLGQTWGDSGDTPAPSVLPQILGRTRLLRVCLTFQNKGDGLSLRHGNGRWPANANKNHARQTYVSPTKPIHKGVRPTGQHRQ